MADNSFNANVGSLFQGMEGFITGKTVVGDAVKFDDGTIICHWWTLALVWLQVHSQSRARKKTVPEVWAERSSRVRS